MKKEKRPQTANVNYIWAMAGSYLIYMGGSLLYDLWKGNTDVTPLLIVPAALLFIAVGGLVVRREWKAYKYAEAHKDDPSTWSDEPLEEEAPEAALAEPAAEADPAAEDAAEDDGEEPV